MGASSPSSVGDSQKVYNQCIALHCNTVHCTVHCTLVHCTTVHCALQCRTQCCAMSRAVHGATFTVSNLHVSLLTRTIPSDKNTHKKQLDLARKRRPARSENTAYSLGNYGRFSWKILPIGSTSWIGSGPKLSLWWGHLEQAGVRKVKLEADCDVCVYNYYLTLSENFIFLSVYWCSISYFIQFVLLFLYLFVFIDHQNWHPSNNVDRREYNNTNPI